MALQIPSATVKLLGVPVTFDASYVVILAVLGGFSDAVQLASWLLFGTIALLVHEFGHALLVRAFGQTPRIALRGLGGVTMWANSPPLSPPRRLLVSLAGPAAGIALGVAALLFFRLRPPTTAFEHDARSVLLWVSLGWSAFNLLPMQPLDGGNAVHQLAHWVTGKPWPRAAAVGSAVLWGLLGLGALKMEWMFGALYAGYMASTQLAAMRGKRGDPILAQIHGLIQQRRFEEALGALAELRKPPAPPALVKAAAELEVELLVELGDVERALEVVLELPAGVQLSPTRVTQLLIRAERPDLALPRLDALRDKGQPNPGLALLAGVRLNPKLAVSSVATGRSAAPRILTEVGWFAFARGQPDAARDALTQAAKLAMTPAAYFDLARLEARLGAVDASRAALLDALNMGFRDRARLLSEPELDPVRAHPDVVAAIDKLPDPAPPQLRPVYRHLRRAAARWPLARATGESAKELVELPLAAPLLPFERALRVMTSPVAPGPARTGPVAVQVLRAATLDASTFVVELEGARRLEPSDERATPEERAAVASALRAVVEQTPEADPRGPARAAAIEHVGELADLIGATLSVTDAERADLLTAAPRERFQRALAILQARGAALTALPDVSCPCCAWEPPASARWTCSACRGAWNTFATRGVCPSCSFQYLSTACPRCGRWSRHAAWYGPGSRAAAS